MNQTRIRHLVRVALVQVLALVGCASVGSNDSGAGHMPNGVPDPASGTVRRAVCIGFTNTAAGNAPCPGTDVDANTVMRWVSDRPATRLLNSGGTIAAIKAAIVAANANMEPDDLLTVFISGHGTQRADKSGDETTDGMDEGLVCWDGTWWDDDVWTFICSLRPCRLELISDTCHSEGNWRAIGRVLTFGLAFEKQYVQLELFDDLPTARPMWGGQIVQIAGCREEGYSYGSAAGGTLTQALNDEREPGIRRYAWFDAARILVEKTGQTPAFSTYNALDAFIHGEALR